MNSKHIIIVVAIIVVVAVIGGYFLLNNQEITANHVPMRLSKSAYMEIPDNPNATLKTDKKGVSRYTDDLDGLNITIASNLSLSSSTKEMNKMKNSVATGSKKTNEENIIIYEKNGTYSAFIKNTEYNDTILIQSLSKDLLIQCWKSIRFHSPTDSFKYNDTTSSGGSSDVVDVAKQTQSTVQKSTSSSSSSTSSSSSDSGYGNSYSDYIGASRSSKSFTGESKSSSYGDSYSDFV